MRTIKLQNTLSGKKEPLKPLKPGHIGMYACGVTTYDDSHIGHAMQAIFFDIMRNYMEYAGYTVNYVRNYTDVDDKIIKRAAENGEAPNDLAARIIKETDEDMRNLGVNPPTHAPKVSEMIPEIISMIETLIEKGAAYATSDGDVYYRVRKKADYGKLSNRKTDELQSGSRDIVSGDKEDALDFALWKKDETQGASWQSPWGPGRPGWHIECSAMSKALLGASFDIHGGGRDLVFPHHENEIAQSESANDAPYASCWIHSGLMTIEKQKMSKSLGNHITIRDFLKSWPAEVLRLSFVERHYSSNIDFSQKVFTTSRRRLLYYYETLAQLAKWLDKAASPEKGPFAEGFSYEEHREAFHQAMSDDFNTCAAIVEINRLFRLANQVIASKKSAAKWNTIAACHTLIHEFGDVLGLFKSDPDTIIDQLKKQVLPELGVTEEEINEAIADRKKARDEKNWQKSDEIRDQLLAKGIELRDDVNTTTWSIKHQEE